MPNGCDEIFHLAAMPADVQCHRIGSPIGKITLLETGERFLLFACVREVPGGNIVSVENDAAFLPVNFNPARKAWRNRRCAFDHSQRTILEFQYGYCRVFSFNVGVQFLLSKTEYRRYGTNEMLKGSMV